MELTYTVTLSQAADCFLCSSLITHEGVKKMLFVSCRTSIQRLVSSKLVLLAVLAVAVPLSAFAQTATEDTTPPSGAVSTTATSTSTGSAPSDPPPIKIGLIGDQTFSTNIQASYGVLQQGVNLLSGKPIDVVLHMGDLTESSNSPAVETGLFNQATGILDHLPVPWYLTAGDHDVNPPAFQQDSPDHSREQLFQQLYGQRVPAFAVHPWYSFDMQGFHFISLYSFGALWSDSRFGNIFLSQVFDDQFAFLQSDLAAHADARAIIVWVHQPLWYHVSGWKRVHELLRKYPVAAVISGHFHYNQDVGVIDGIHYITVGATGGFKKNGNRQAGDVDHVSILTVRNPHDVTLDLFALDGQPLSLTPRVDMDRVQALDVQLGNFFDFAQVNPVFSKNGQLVSDCASGSPALIQIAEIGNPIDLPLDVQIGLAAPGVSLSHPAFASDVCQQVISGTECALKRTVRTFISNYSSVDIDTFDGPLWSSGLSGLAGAGAVLNFNIKTTFTGSSGQFFLQTTASTTVQACQ
jgi:3',5'-cyclic AMP phosphodiesterase CpdA